MIYNTLLWIHIAAGSVTLISAFCAMVTKIADFKHSWHILSGRIFYYGMVIVFITAVIMALIRPNIFLLLIAIFSFYFAFTGKRTAQNRQGTPATEDHASAYIMLTAALAMIVWGSYLLTAADDNGVTLIVFGIAGVLFPLTQLRRFRKGGLKGKERIASHLGNMMGATIAAITAFLVTNIQTDPVWIAWIAPTIIITPIIFMMIRRVNKPGYKFVASRKFDIPITEPGSDNQ